MGRESTSSRRIPQEVSSNSSSGIDPLSKISCDVAKEEKVLAEAPANFLREGERRERGEEEETMKPISGHVSASCIATSDRYTIRATQSVHTDLLFVYSIAIST
ncbi:hypothetical protein MRB53_026781 [Persea americana]|uniref:Uncharacterized protein n=1 Tax=Persea americana TaxID=3435 RepID=A0ACC2LJC5_PERAE|nr:hypothetical protein MRB53_026781 [Persea americana]